MRSTSLPNIPDTEEGKWRYKMSSRFNTEEVARKFCHSTQMWTASIHWFQKSVRISNTYTTILNFIKKFHDTNLISCRWWSSEGFYSTPRCEIFQDNIKITITSAEKFVKRHIGDATTIKFVWFLKRIKFQIIPVKILWQSDHWFTNYSGCRKATFAIL